MSLSTRAIQSKIKSVKNIRKITKAMELVAASKMKRAVEYTLATREYSESALEILVNISKQQHIEHPLLTANTDERKLLIIFSSDKGLCGGFNVSVARKVRSFVHKHPNTDFITVGKRAHKIARKYEGEIKASFDLFPDNASTEDLRGLFKIIFDEFSSKRYRKIYVVYTEYVSALKQIPMARQILPIKEEIVRDFISDLDKIEHVEEKPVRDLSLYLFEPGDDEVLDAVLPRLVEVNVFQGFLESVASEHSARMMAMKNATENATEIVDQLVLTFNRARQASITQEISEIAAGADAIQ